MYPVLIIHGGAGSLKPKEGGFQNRHHSLERILRSVYPRLEKSISAIEAVTLAVEMLEDDPLYNAGLGSKIQADGKIRMCASIMDGTKRRFGGCVNVERVKNPIRLAQKLLTRKDRVLAGHGAEKFAREMGLKFASPFTPERKEEFRYHRSGKTGTVGAVALDRQGRLAAATSTGGRGHEYPGRVSDTPTVAANFANRACALSATGIGEQIVEHGVAVAICAQVEAGTRLNQAVQRLLSKAKREGAQFGLIALDHHGKIAASTTTRYLIWAAARAQGFEIHPYTKSKA